MNAAVQGWYPDPNGDWQLRYWDGQRWTEHVSTGRWVTTAPLEPPVVPDTEQQVWADGRHVLTTHRWFPREHASQPPAEIPLWAVADTEVRAASGAGVGTVVAVVAYPGYTDRRHWVAPDVVDAHRVAAYVRLWGNRNRRKAWPNAYPR